MKLEVKELPLIDCNEFWGELKYRISAYEKLKILGVTGGIPKYLEEILPNEPAEKNINQLCFRPEGILYQEYDQIFSDLFSRRAPTFDKIVKVLASGSKSLDEICKALKIEKSGNISSYLHELIIAGFISEDFTWSIQNRKVSNLKVFRLKDNYIRFYLIFILPNKHRIDQGNLSDKSVVTLSGWETTMGLQFENLVINNLNKLYELLEIEPQQVEMAGPFFQRKTETNRGCQIDLLIQTKSATLYLCEIKFHFSEIGIEVVSDVQKKIKSLKYPKGYSIRPVLIHVNGVTPGVSESDLFDKIINFGEFFTNSLS